MLATATKLAPLRSRLGDLRRRRQLVRLGTGAAGFAAALLAGLLVAFIFDMTLQMGRLERLFALGLWLVVAAAAWRWLLRPFLGRHESDLDMAILVESRLKIDSDLVAALQFESDEATSWGSGHLRGAVVDYVAEFGNSVNVFEGLPVATMRKRVIALGVVLLVALPFIVMRPRHVPVFLNRFFLGSAHYPTATQITEVRVNGRVAKPGLQLRFPHGKPLKIEVVSAGRVADNGRIGLAPADRPDADATVRAFSSIAAWCFAGAPPDIDTFEAAVPLVPGKTTNDQQVFSGETPQFTEPLTFQITLGDAWTDPRRIELTPLPVVTLDLEATPPEYARIATPNMPKHTGSQVLSVIEGSQVAVKLTCTNKALNSATLKVNGKEYPLKSDGEKRVWTLPPEGTPFERVTSAFAFTLQAVDEDELPLERPIAGHLRLQTDREPRVSAAVVTDRVLPTATPTLGYKATDDFGLAELRLHREVLRADQSGDGPGTEKSVVSVRKVDAQTQPVLQLPLEGETLRVDLRSLKLEKGDKVTIMLEAIDYRGKTKGKSALSEPLVFQVTDQSGILEGLSEADQKSAKQLDVIIQRQLGIGEAP